MAEACVPKKKAKHSKKEADLSDNSDKSEGKYNIIYM